jgi:hypothetical protein
VSEVIQVRQPVGRKKILPRLRIQNSTVRGVLSIIAAGMIWEIAGRTFLSNPLFFAPLSAVFAKMQMLWQAGTLQEDILVSGQEFIIGFVLASIAVIAIGVIMASSKAICDVVDPWVSMLYATPFVALAPLLTLWLGIGMTAHIAVVFIVVIFPVLINTHAGLANSDRDLIEVARSYGADQRQIFVKIRHRSRPHRRRRRRVVRIARRTRLPDPDLRPAIRSGRTAGRHPALRARRRRRRRSGSYSRTAHRAVALLGG